jgi:2-polyprenyl-3-methyl-5-hydroxy-6-metoxy-1,4-benzoquinol methylase
MIVSISGYTQCDNKNWRQDIPAVQEHFKASESEALLFPRRNGVVDNDDLVAWRTNCPCCLASEFHEVFTKWGFVHRECRSCGTIYVANVLHDSILLEQYQKSVTDELALQRTLNSKSIEYWQQVYNRIAIIVANSIYDSRTATPLHSTDFQFPSDHQRAKLLDVGTGAGIFPRLLIDSYSDIFDVYATEYAAASEEIVRDLLGDNFFYRASLSDLLEKETRFNVISLWGVIEHLTDPRQVLTNARNLIEAGGILILLYPNLKSAAHRILGIQTPTLNPREHLNFFTRSSMLQMLSACGFLVTHQGQELPVIDLMYDYISDPDAFRESVIQNDQAYYHTLIARAV